jgi:hypothetical protein
MRPIWTSSAFSLPDPDRGTLNFGLSSANPFSIPRIIGCSTRWSAKTLRASSRSAVRCGGDHSRLHDADRPTELLDAVSSCPLWGKGWARRSFAVREEDLVKRFACSECDLPDEERRRDGNFPDASFGQGRRSRGRGVRRNDVAGGDEKRGELASSTSPSVTPISDQRRKGRGP